LCKQWKEHFVTNLSRVFLPQESTSKSTVSVAKHCGGGMVFGETHSEEERNQTAKLKLTYRKVHKK